MSAQPIQTCEIFVARWVARACVPLLLLVTATTANGQAPGAKAPVTPPAAPRQPAPVVKPAPTAKAAPQAVTTTKPAAAPAPHQWSPEDAAARDKVLASPAWVDTMRQFEDWLSAQPLYDAEQVKQIRSRLTVGIDRMSGPQLERFIVDLQDKLKVLTSDAAQQAGAYLAQTFAVASPAYAARVRQRLPDVLTMTPAQINQQLAVFASKQQATVQMQQTFNDSRTQQIAYNQQLIQAQQASRAAAGQAESAGAAAATKGNNFTPARDYFPDAGNDGPFGPGTSIGLGWGFF